MPRTVSVLCCGPRSQYRQIPDLELYHHRRNAWTFPGGTPIVAHPPCRRWSHYLRNQAKPAPGEDLLGVWCATNLRCWGGVLEQPAKSHLFGHCGLPLPGQRQGKLVTIEVYQYWWGYRTLKATWLCLSRIDLQEVQCPLRLYAPGMAKHHWRTMTHAQRQATTLDFAAWLVELARKVE